MKEFAYTACPFSLPIHVFLSLYSAVCIRRAAWKVKLLLSKTRNQNAAYNERRDTGLVSRRCAPYLYKMIQIKPPLPSLMIRVRVSWSFFRASSGIRLSFACRSSLTSSWKLRPKILDCQILLVSPSNSWSR